MATARTLVVQSCPNVGQDHWLARCTNSVADWAQRSGFEYRLTGDEVLAGVPDWYREKTAGRLPIQFDLARLQLIEQALEEGFGRACWIDADVLLFRPQHLKLDYRGDCAFGREYWVQGEVGGRFKVRRNVHNAICSFDAGSPVLTFLRHATMRVIERADPRRIAPQMVGPKLLSALHSIVGFELLESVGAFSPWVLDDLMAADGPALRAQRGTNGVPLAGVNLCGSLAGDRDLTAVCEALLAGISWPEE
tara:strand:- start:5760 stop:6509 length:750 start_codon:yes stop_codon:yes gene_type:complete